jgi:hypothetical protein
MHTRTITKSVTFGQPFELDGIDGIQPAGTYVTETEEELLEALSFPAWRRLSTSIFLPRTAANPMSDQVATIDPAALDAALVRDAAHG